MIKMFHKNYWAVLFISFSAIIYLNTSCSRNDTKTLEKQFIGIWHTEYEDSGGTHNRYLNFRYDNNSHVTATMDEPDEDWYGVPIWNLIINNNIIHAELWWGMEQFDGTLENNGSIIKGNRIIDNGNAQKPILYKRVNSDASLSFKKPRIDNSGKTQKEYKYEMPSDDNDGFAIGSLSEAAADASKIYNLMNRILSASIPNIHGILILKDGKLVCEEYFYGYDKARTHRLHSETKSFTSALIGIALDKGLIKDVNSNVYEYFQEHKNAPWVSNRYGITIKHLLSMTAGLQWRPLTANSTNLRPDLVMMYESKSWLEYLLNKKQSEQPGTHFFYNDGLSILLGCVLSRASGNTVKDFAEEYLFKPLNITKYSWDVHADGTTRSEGGLKMRPRDMLKFGLLFLNKGHWNGKRILSEKWIAESTARQTPLNEEQYGYQHYGYQWWMGNFVINHRVIKSYFARGFGEQFIFVVPEIEMVVVFTAGNYFQVEHRPLEMMAEYILPAFLGDKVMASDQHISPENIDKITGEYSNNRNERFIIKFENNKLYVIDPGKNKIEVFMINDKHYYSKNPPADGILCEGENGKISCLEIYINGLKVDELKKL